MFRYYYNKSIRNYVVLMGTLFNSMYVKRPNKAVAQQIPLSYSSKERFVAYGLMLNAQTAINPELQTILPKMSYYMQNLRYNSKAKVNTQNYSISVTEEIKDDTGLIVRTHKKQLAPVPYIFSFELGIYTRYEDDMLQVIEQILPYFQPHFNAKIKEYSVAGVVDRDIYINLMSVTPSEDFEGSMHDGRRIIQWTLNFDLYGYLYPAIDDTQIIKRTIVNFVGEEVDLLDEEASILRVTSEVDPFDADKDDEYIIKTKVEYPNG